MTTQLESPTFQSHDLPEGVTFNHPDHLTYAIGDIPEVAMALNSLAGRIQAAQAEVLPDFGDAHEADSLVDFEILPIGEAEALEHAGAEATDTDDAQTIIERNIGMLFDLKDHFGNDSEVVAWREKSQDQDRPEHKKRWFDYLMTVIKDEGGKVTALVADSLEENNAIYVWRADVSDVSEWTEVFKGDKRSARHQAQARQVRHTGDIKERVMNYLTMPAEKYLNLITRPRARQ